MCNYSTYITFDQNIKISAYIYNLILILCLKHYQFNLTKMWLIILLHKHLLSESQYQCFIRPFYKNMAEQIYFDSKNDLLPLP